MVEGSGAGKVVTARRRQQNRQAQKNYRERQKHQLATLTSIVETREVYPTSLTPSLETCPGGSDKRDSFETAPIHQDQEQALINILPDSSLSLYGASNLRQAGANPDLGLQYLMRLCPESDQALIRHRLQTGELTLEDILTAGLAALSANQQDQCHSSDSNEGSISSYMEPRLRTDKIIVLLNSFNCPSLTLPDMHSNHLHMKQVTSVAALRANVELIGLTYEQLISPETESPFFSNMSPWLPAVPTAVTAYLQPTTAQLLYAHHPYLDALPFPTLRQRAIEHFSQEPSMFAEDEFCDDLEDGGLVCWGSIVGDCRSVEGTGTPWDARSWEVRPWFLRKWAFLLGGERELMSQSKWWRAMQGEKGSV